MIRSLAALRRSFLLPSLIFASSFYPAFAHADDAVAPPPSELPPLVVSATRVPTPVDQLGSSLTVITADDIERKQRRTLPDILQDVPGLNLVQTGGPGGTTSVFMRGTNANHTKVLIDGIDAGDPSSADGSFDFSQILAAGIDRVEVLRGPQSALYGADAIGGVINIVTKKGSGPGELHGSLEGGSFGTFNQTAGLSGSLSRFNYAFDFAHYRSDDTPVTPANLLPAGRQLNPDIYDNKSYSMKLGADVTDNFDLGLVTRFVDTSLGSTSDDSVGFTGPEAVRSITDNKEIFTRGTAHLVLFDGTFDQTLGIAYNNYHRSTLDPNVLPVFPSISRGDRFKIDWQGNITVTKGEVVTLGAEHQTDKINANAPVVAAISNDAGFVQLQSSVGDRFFNALSVRSDNNDKFGGYITWRDAPAFLIPETGTKLKGTVGTGYKAPTLVQLYQSFPLFGFFANPLLKPETSFGWDAGFEQGLFAKRVQFGATYFHNSIKNLIASNATFTNNINVGQATTYGVESFVSYKPWDPLTLRGDYTYTIARNDITQRSLQRRPKNKGSVNATWQITDAASVSATVLYVGSWIDINRSGTISNMTADGYTLVNFAGSYELGHGVTAFARIDNALDRHYQDPTGFMRPGLGVFGGIKVSFDVADLTK